MAESDADAGFAFDGDADRVIATDERGNIVDGDRIMGICAKAMKAEGRLKKDTLVVTVMSNIGLKKRMTELGINVAETKVGDRYVLEEMLRGGYTLGGEQSGHIIFMDYATTGDGILSALHVLGLMVRTGKPLAELAGFMKVFPQEIRSFPVARKVPFDQLSLLPTAMEECRRALGNSGRTIVRYSGTENKIRVLVEAEASGDVDIWITRLCAVAEQELN